MMGLQKALFSLLIGSVSVASLAAQEVFRDDFETTSNAWIISDSNHAAVIDSGDPAHGRVLSLTPMGGFISALFNRLLGRPIADPVYALVHDSATWQDFRLEGSLYVPEDGDSYLGIVYHYGQRPRLGPVDSDDTNDQSRTDFDSVYLMVRGHESYIRVNPHHDWNPARALYEEFRVNLEGDAAVGLREWIPFAAEVIGDSVHFYVKDLTTPQLTFTLAERTSGFVGFTPRSIGTTVWIDDVRVVSIGQFSYSGPALPVAPQRGEQVLVDWQALGPFVDPQGDLEAGAADPNWQPFATDPRGAVVAARVGEHRSAARYAYFRTQVSPTRPTVLEFSTSMPLAVWIDGEPAEAHGDNVGRLDFRRVAWFDFREGAQLSINLEPGTHTIVVRSTSDYSGTGFFARLRS